MYSEGREYNATETTSDDGAAASGGQGCVRRLSTPTLAAALRCHLAAARRGGRRNGADLISDNLG